MSQNPGVDPSQEPAASQEDDMSATQTPAHNHLLVDLTLEELILRANPTPNSSETVSQLPSMDVQTNWEATKDIDAWSVLDRPLRIQEAIGPASSVSIFRRPQRYETKVIGKRSILVDFD
jgi:hypothetical protein